MRVGNYRNVSEQSTIRCQARHPVTCGVSYFSCRAWSGVFGTSAVANYLIMADREDQVFGAKLAEQAERYDEMVEYMNKVSKMGDELTADERNLLSVAYKNVIGARRASWRILKTIENRATDDDKQHESILKAYKSQVEDELKDLCEKIISLLDDHLISNVGQNNEAKVFYYKMKGDYYRYLAEFLSDEDRKKAAENSLTAYKTASDTASNLPPTHPVRLGLALNFSVFYYEILNSPDRACRLAKAAFDDAVAETESAKSDSSQFKDSTLILQLLRDNLTLWTSDMSPQDDIEDDKEQALQDVDSNDGN